MRATTRIVQTLCLSTLFSAALLAGAWAQDPPPGGGGFGGGGLGGGGFGGRQRGSQGPRPYADVITATAKSEPGVFTVHRIDERVLFEIPANMLNREMLWTTEIAQLPAHLGYGGQAVNNKVVRWTRRG